MGKNFWSGGQQIPAYETLVKLFCGFWPPLFQASRLGPLGHNRQLSLFGSVSTDTLVRGQLCSALSFYQVAYNAATRYLAAEGENDIDQIIDFGVILTLRFSSDEYYISGNVGWMYIF